MKTKNNIKILSLLLATGIFIASCKKNEDNENDTDTDTAVASDHILAESAFNDVNNIADEAASGSLSSYLTSNNSDEKAFFSACATITNDTTVTPKMLTIDFDTTNCLCSDGRNRRGKINVAYTGQYRDSASTHTITFTNYFVNDNQILGTKTVTNNGRNVAGRLVNTIQVNGQIIKANGGGTITWTSDRKRTWVIGESTPAWNDDVYYIAGTGNGISTSGTFFTATIVQTLRREMSCRNIVAGQLAITPAGKATRYINFGTGTCDNDATVTINGKVYNITLP